MAPPAPAEGELITADLGPAGRWSIAGMASGLMMLACMLVLRVLTGVPALPELFQDQGLERNQFRLAYQLILSLANGQDRGGGGKACQTSC